jgi:RNA-directed DNA polymerase
LATALTLLTTYEGKRPTGRPTSPVISNFICLKMDEALKSFCETHRINFTRYADDLSFSFNQLFSQDLIDRLIELIFHMDLKSIQKTPFKIFEPQANAYWVNRKYQSKH